MQQKLVIKLGLHGLTAPALVEKGRSHITACTGNRNVTLPADFLTDFAAACDALEIASMASQQNGGRTPCCVTAMAASPRRAVRT